MPGSAQALNRPVPRSMRSTAISNPTIGAWGVGAQQLRRFPLGAPVGDDVVDHQHPVVAARLAAHQDPGLAVPLGFLAVEGVGERTPEQPGRADGQPSRPAGSPCRRGRTGSRAAGPRSAPLRPARSTRRGRPLLVVNSPKRTAPDSTSRRARRRLSTCWLPEAVMRRKRSRSWGRCRAAVRRVGLAHDGTQTDLPGQSVRLFHAAEGAAAARVRGAAGGARRRGVGTVFAQQFRRGQSGLGVPGRAARSARCQHL